MPDARVNSGHELTSTHTISKQGSTAVRNLASKEQLLGFSFFLVPKPVDQAEEETVNVKHSVDAKVCCFH